MMSLLSNLDGLTPEGLQHLLGDRTDRTATYVDTSDNNSCVSVEKRTTPKTLPNPPRKQSIGIDRMQKSNTSKLNLIL